MTSPATPQPPALPENLSAPVATVLGTLRGRQGFEATYAYPSGDLERVIFHDGDARAAFIPAQVLRDGHRSGVLGDIAQNLLDDMGRTGVGTPTLVPPGADPSKEPVGVGVVDEEPDDPQSEGDNSLSLDQIRAQGRAAAEAKEPPTPPFFDDPDKTKAWVDGYFSGISPEDRYQAARVGFAELSALLEGDPACDLCRQYLAEALNVLPGE